MASTLALSMATGLACVFIGLTLSYYADLAPGGAIVLVAAGAYVVAAGTERLLAR